MTTREHAPVIVLGWVVTGAPGQEVSTPRLKMTSSGAGFHRVAVTVGTGSAVDESDERSNGCKLSVQLD